jgi:hypothetical protein
MELVELKNYNTLKLKLIAGEALAKKFAQLGAKLILSARRVEELERVKASLSGKLSRTLKPTQFFKEC